MDRSAIVTGGLGGIGQAICGRLVASGYCVVAADIVHDGPPQEGQGQIATFLDLSDSASIDAVCELAAGCGKLSALVNCAGVIAECQADQAPGSNVARMLDVNLLGAARMTAAAVSRMDRGAIVNISSISSRLPEIASAVFYGASKAALETYTRAAARSLAPRGIRVNAVAPGFIDVAMSDAMRTIAYTEGSPLRRVALGRMGTAEEIAECVDFLLSERAAYVVGATLVVDGGLALG